MSNDIIKGLGYAHMAIAAKDFDKSLAFYKALGMTVYTAWGEGDSRIALLDMGDGSLVELFAKPDLNTDRVAGGGGRQSLPAFRLLRPERGRGLPHRSGGGRDAPQAPR